MSTKVHIVVVFALLKAKKNSIVPHGPFHTNECVCFNTYHTVRGKILEWEKIGEFGELWSLRQ